MAKTEKQDTTTLGEIFGIEQAEPTQILSILKPSTNDKISFSKYCEDCDIDKYHAAAIAHVYGGQLKPVSEWDGLSKISV
jgi:hypothetical protein